MKILSLRIFLVKNKKSSGEYENFWIFQILKFGPKIRKFRKGPPLQKSQKFPIFENFMDNIAAYDPL